MLFISDSKSSYSQPSPNFVIDVFPHLWSSSLKWAQISWGSSEAYCYSETCWWWSSSVLLVLLPLGSWSFIWLGKLSLSVWWGSKNAGGLNKFLCQEVKTQWSQQDSSVLADSQLLNNVEHDPKIWSVPSQNRIRQGLKSISIVCWFVVFFFFEQKYTSVKPLRVTHKVEHYIKSYCIQILNKRPLRSLQYRTGIWFS